jgi:hypothetical protein
MEKAHVSNHKVQLLQEKVTAGKWIAPLFLCFSEQVGAMVIGAIEIDGVHLPAWGCKLFPWKCTKESQASVPEAASCA